MSNPVVWFEINTQNADSLRGFYAEIFGWKYEIDEAIDYAIVQCGDKGIPGGIGKAESAEQQHLTFYTEVPDITESLGRIEGLGGKTIMPRTQLPGGITLGMFLDPEGNRVGLVEPMPTK